MPTNGKGLWSEQVSWDEGHFWEGGLNFIMGPTMKVLATPERLAFGLKQMIAYEHANGVTAYNEPVPPLPRSEKPNQFCFTSGK